MNAEARISGTWAQTGTQPRIAIIGAGMSGIAAVVKLRKAGYTDLTVFEKTDRVGGTWRENTYPGLSCDVASPWYSFSFALNPNWTHRYSYGPEIQAYMETGGQGLRRHRHRALQHGHHRRRVRRPAVAADHLAGRTGAFDIVLTATGILHQPMYPDIEGLDDFRRRLLPHRPLGSLGRARRQTGRHHRHRLHRGADRRRHHRTGGRDVRLSAHAAMDGAPAPEESTRGPGVQLCGLCRSCAGRPTTSTCA